MEVSELRDVTVFRLSVVVGGAFVGACVAGGVVDSLFALPDLESHEKLIPSFFGPLADGVALEDFEEGDGPQGIEGRFPDSPLVFGGIFLGELGWSIGFSEGLSVLFADLIEDVSALSSS